MQKRWLCVSILLLAMGMLPRLSVGAKWEASGEIGFSHFFAEMDDQVDPVTVLIRVENHSQQDLLKITQHFVQMTDAKNQRIRPVSVDEVVSDHLAKLRELMPQHAEEIDVLLGEIRADYPQEKIVQVYARLKKYMRQGRPITWRTGLKNMLLGKKSSNAQDIKQAEFLIEEIGTLSKNHLWPTDVAPETNVTGMVFFKQTIHHPVNIFFQQGADFIGTRMHIVAGDKKK
jgi:hypothetical protein